jgi:hypothetical protein
MTQMQFADAAEISGTRRTADGYLVADCRVARTGIQEYMGYEIGDEAEPNKVYRIYRPEAEVFKTDNLASFAHRPVTLGHPANGVTADNWKKEAVGVTGGDVVRDGGYVRVPMVVMDQTAIDAIESGTKQISMGYVCNLLLQKGTTDDGQPFDGIQKDLRQNHAALVKAGRAGFECRVGDEIRDSRARNPQQKDTPMTKSVTIDGKAFEVTDEVAAAFAKLQADKDAAVATAKEAGTVVDAAKSLLADMKKDKEAADKAAADAKAAADKAEADKKSADDIHAMAADLAATMDKAKKIAPDLDTKGKTADAIRKEAVSKKLGDEAVKGKDQAYFNAAFDMLAVGDDDPVAKAIKSGPTKVGDAVKKANDDYDSYLRDAWKRPASQATN